MRCSNCNALEWHAEKWVSHPAAVRRFNIFDSRLQIVRGYVTSLHQVAPHLERVSHPAPIRRSNVFASRLQIARGYVTSLHIRKVVDKRLSSEWVSHPGARGRAVFVSSGAGVAGRSRSPLWCSARSNNTFYSLFDPKCFQVPLRTPMDTPKPDKDLCNAKKKLKSMIPILNDQNMQE
ncbi:hypothetical protein F2Q70_00035586 [Brassica cretica]|uniref:Uncharacterized protein n=1 Tax=Brassica cretica TaxID=69181 RepID=A0A8S9JYE6_BRACR|nr:hypothetical protein F2Q70_00035586 [Brassica cretica]